jgi:hypothetical protein
MPGQPFDRQAIKNALFALAQTAVFPIPVNGQTTWQETGRRLKLWDRVDPSAQPAMFMVQHREQYEVRGEGRLTRRYLDMGFWCYAPTGSDGVIGDDWLDAMETGLEVALQPDDASRNELTLGGVCQWARIMREDNMFIRDPGDIDGQALLVLPVRVLIP